VRWEHVVTQDDVVGGSHATTIVETEGGDILCAWFGGAVEADPNVAIWMSRRTAGGGWSPQHVAADEPDIACFNPVLFCVDERLWLFYQAGSSPEDWTGYYRTSDDDGYTWSESTIMPAGLFGPIKNKPIRLADGRIACPSSTESYQTWAGWIHIYDPATEIWAIRGPLTVPGTWERQRQHGVIQPTLWEVEPGHVVALLRSTQYIGAVCRSDSYDGGETWSPAYMTDLPNPNSGIDVVKLVDGRVVLIYNHSLRDDPTTAGPGVPEIPGQMPYGRGTIHIAVSNDDGATWSDPWVVEDGGREYAYPAIIQVSDGTVHTTYTWNRTGLRYAAFSLDEIDQIAAGTMPKPQQKDEVANGMSDLAMRAASADDGEFAYRAKRAAFKEYVDEAWGWDEDEQRRLHERRYQAQDYRVVSVTGVDVGVMAIVMASGALVVNQLFILPEHQGQGIGGRCMSVVLNEAQELRLPVRLRVLKNNPRALAFYERLGFARVGETGTHIALEMSP